MGVINCSPESFFHGSYVGPQSIRARAEEMVREGAEIIDIGARSTAPLSPRVSEETEADGSPPPSARWTAQASPVSVDTMYPSVLERALSHDIHAANDISGLSSPAYARIVADAGRPHSSWRLGEHRGMPRA